MRLVRGVLSFFFCGLLCAALFAGAAAFEVWLFSVLPAGRDAGVRRVEIKPGTGSREIGRTLSAAGVVVNADRFYALALLTRSGGPFQAGEYDFSGVLTPLAVMAKMRRGEVVTYTLTFPEGGTVRDVAAVIARSGLATEAEVLAVAGDPEFARSLGIEAQGLEGYLFPETYVFRRTHDVAAILRRMVAEFQRHVPEAFRVKAQEAGLSLHEAVTLASIIEKETAAPGERPLISAVFRNRLKKGIPLQSDPTAVYDLPDFSGPVTPAHLKRRSPYNTYVISGLPPGPICNPGAASLRAAVSPSDVPYLFFVSQNDGTHRFSTTFGEHGKAVSDLRVKQRESRNQNGTAQNGAPLSPPR